MVFEDLSCAVAAFDFDPISTLFCVAQTFSPGTPNAFFSVAQGFSPGCPDASEIAQPRLRGLLFAFRHSDGYELFLEKPSGPVDVAD